LGLGLFGHQGDNGVDFGVDLLNLSQVRSQHFPTGKFLAPNPLRQFCGCQKTEFGCRHAV
jgi:hypothetical protein